MAGPGHWTFILLNNPNVFKINAKFVLKNLSVFDFFLYIVYEEATKQTVTNTNV